MASNTQVDRIVRHQLMAHGGPRFTTGNVFFVDDSGSDSGSGKDPGAPFATIDYAIGQCTASQGDIIYVMPGHAESIAAATDITVDVAGIWICGLGWGQLRPQLTYAAAGSVINVTAANCRISNLVLIPGAASVVDAINITAAGTIVEDCETMVHATSEFVSHITVTDVEDVIIRNNRLRSLHTAGSTSGLVIDGCDDIQIYGNEIVGHFGEHAIDNTTPSGVDECLRASLHHNMVRNWSSTAGDLTIQMDADATGESYYNCFAGGLALNSNVDYGNLNMIENYLTDAADVTAVVHPATAAAN